MATLFFYVENFKEKKKDSQIISNLRVLICMWKIKGFSFLQVF